VSELTVGVAARDGGAHAEGQKLAVAGHVRHHLGACDGVWGELPALPSHHLGFGDGGGLAPRTCATADGPPGSPCPASSSRRRLAMAT
jgi:hypothetical protein